MQKVFKDYICLNNTNSSKSDHRHTLVINVAQCLFSCKTTYGYKFVFANCTVNVYTDGRAYRVIACMPCTQITK